MPFRLAGCAVFGLIALTATTGKGQQPAQTPEQPVVRITVTLVQVDAVVTDAKGRRITDLKPEDFQIKQDGKLQSITHFSYVDKSVPPKPHRVKSDPADKLAPPLPSTAPTPDAVRRIAALVVDDLGLSFEGMAYTRQALRKYVNEQMQAGDLMAIIPTGGGMGALQQFTADVRLLNAAINTLRWNPYGRVSIESFAPAGAEVESETGQDARLRESDLLEERFSVGTMASIAQVVRRISELPGRKSLVVFSENLRILQRGEVNFRIMEELQRLTDLANRAGVVLYTIDARGLPVLGFTAADQFAPEVSAESAQAADPSARLRQMLDGRRNEYYESQDGLSYLAGQTGGLFLRNTNDIAGSIRQVMDDQSGYYLLGYVPQEGTFEKDSKNRKFHQISVKVLRPGLQVRSRTGFFNMAETQRKAPPQTRAGQLQAAMISPFGAEGVRVRLTSLFKDSAKAGSYVQSLLFIEAQDLTFTDEADDWHKAVLDIVTVTYHGRDDRADQTDRTYTLRMRGETYRQALKQGFIYGVNHPVRKAGAFHMRALVRDAAAQRIGSAGQFIEIPDVKKGRLALSGIVLKTAPAQLQKKFAESVTASAESGQLEEFAEGHPAVRRFYQGQVLTYGFQAINAIVDSKTRQSSLLCQVRLFRNGKQIYVGEPKPVTEQGRIDPKHVLGGGLLRLGREMTPGEYVFQIVVTDRLAKEKYSRAAQWIDFVVLPNPPAAATPRSAANVLP